VVNTNPRVTPGYLVPGGTRMPETGFAWPKPSLVTQTCVVGGVQQAAAQVMFAPKHALRTIDAVTGIPPSAQRRT
jgi:hypothetical protein